MRYADVLSGLEPKDVFRYFGEISAIPRGSGREKAVSDYLLAFADRQGLEATQDPALNIIIKKPGTSGYEDGPTVILQGHMDMVWEKNDESPHCFETDPIPLTADGDRLSADGTTLGGDNGIAVAYAMALLASTAIPHPPLEVLMTTEEEVGLRGAAQVSPASLSGKILINLDAEEEGKFFVSCAGGTRCTLSLPLAYEPAPQGYESLELKISGLRGGHSGMDIHLGRANANALMGRLLKEVSGPDICLAAIYGGAMVNVIPRSAGAVLLVRQDLAGQVKEAAGQVEKAFLQAFEQTDPGLSITCRPGGQKITRVATRDTGLKIIDFLNRIPTGVQSMSPDIRGLVESSLNLGVVRVTDQEHLECFCSVRSCNDLIRDGICSRLERIARDTGALFQAGASYPAWEYRKESRIRPLAETIYQNRYGRAAEICALHAGLECGILGDILKDMDMISLGPDIFHVHTPDEYLSISSVERTWEFLCDLLKHLTG